MNTDLRIEDEVLNLLNEKDEEVDILLPDEQRADLEPINDGVEISKFKIVFTKHGELDVVKLPNGKFSIMGMVDGYDFTNEHVDSLEEAKDFIEDQLLATDQYENISIEHEDLEEEV